ncbi:MAG: DUF1269 domain-containing family protein [Thiotrichaceae bacterium]|nr:MAG: DUF1269 domain-containing family protein [Thiotrichaceae bacterium]
MSEKNTCVSIYSSHQSAEQALGELRVEGLDVQQISIVGKGYQNEEHPVGFYTTGEHIYYQGVQTAFWSNLQKLLSSASFFWLPGFGTLATAGFIVRLLVEGQESIEVGGGFNVLGKSLFSMGIPRDSIVDYEQAIKAGKILLIVHGMRSDVERAYHILHSKTQQVAVHMA